MSVETLPQRLAALHADTFGWARHCCGDDAAMAEEVMQNAYLKCLQGKLREPDSAGLKSWWLEVVRLTALEEWRRRRLGWGRWIFPINEEQVDASAGRIELDDEAVHLQGLVARLPARQSEVLHLVFYQGLTLAEAAIVMHVGVGSARRHYERGKARLREWLEKEE
jgi:RNA polymerase sigma-70 factor (ECF subfamily)